MTNSMTEVLRAVKGMNDILPPESARWEWFEAKVRALMQRYAYKNVRTPIVEPTALFVRGIGEATDIVEKEMYSFVDEMNGDQLSLRPEGTAPTVRAALEHNLLYQGPQRLWYGGPLFRHERPQKGRYRQFHQIGCEAFGIAEPFLDAEQIALLADYFARLGVGARLKLNTVGDAACRPAYLAELKAYLAGRKGELCADCNDRIERNPLRVLDCKVESCQPVLDAAPRLLDRLCDGCRAHFDQVKAALDALGVRYEVDGRLVRGLDYYVRTAYEFTSDALGSQSAVAGGGRYDRLVETLGGPPTPGIGFALGEERLAMILEKAGKVPPAQGPEVFFVTADAEGALEALRRAAELRREGIACDLDPRGGKMKAQFKQAERVGARYALVLGGNEVRTGQAKLKDVRTREETAVALAELPTRLRRP
jgi:histidyl-tRNA synthetase